MRTTRVLLVLGAVLLCLFCVELIRLWWPAAFLLAGGGGLLLGLVRRDYERRTR